MPRYAAFLRAINVGGRRITNAELGARFERFGLDDVKVFRASGNVIFSADADGDGVGELTALIEQGLAQSLGYEVVTFLRSPDEMRELAAARPFEEAAVAASTGRMHVAMLRGLPAADVRRAVLELATAEDRLAFGACELFWLPSGGMSDSGLDLKAIDRLLGPMTLRTKGTVEQVAAKYFAG